jgi:hypothetical protein
MRYADGTLVVKVPDFGWIHATCHPLPDEERPAAKIPKATPVPKGVVRLPDETAVDAWAGGGMAGLRFGGKRKYRKNLKRVYGD